MTRHALKEQLGLHVHVDIVKYLKIFKRDVSVRCISAFGSHPPSLPTTNGIPFAFAHSGPSYSGRAIFILPSLLTLYSDCEDSTAVAKSVRVQVRDIDLACLAAEHGFAY